MKRATKIRAITRKNKVEFRIYQGEKIGYIIYQKSREIDLVFIKPQLPSISWVLGEIEIKENFQGKGFGTVLLSHSMQEVLKIEKLPIALIPPKSAYTDRIVTWYKRHGFEFDGKIPGLMIYTGA